MARATRAKAFTASPKPAVRLPLLALPPGNERANGVYLQVNLHGLIDYTSNFEDAVRLADHIESLMQPRAERLELEKRASSDLSLLDELSRRNAEDIRYWSWVAIAARDAVMSVDHFEHLFGRTRELARKIPTVATLVDNAELKKARQLFEGYFPDFRALRDAVAHEAERASSRVEVERYSFSGHQEAPGMKIDGASLITLTVLNGRSLQMTWKGQVVSMSVDEPTLVKLCEVRDAVIAAFNPVIGALEGKDLGD